MNAHDVADYLQSHPEFFEQYAEMLSSLTIPHPHGGRAISLTERQMMTLRERHKALELRLAELLRYGQENDALADKLHRWTQVLLTGHDQTDLPERLSDTLAEIFDVPNVTVRVWHVAAAFADQSWVEPVPAGLINYVNQLLAPYCGKPLEANSGAAALIDAPVASLALLPLRSAGATDAFGMLILASPDVQRFNSTMSTEFLSRIGEIASAALLRVLPED